MAEDKTLPKDMLPIAPEVSADLELYMTGMSAEERDAYIKHVEKIRATRKPNFGSFTQKLVLPTRTGYKRHWFNDEPGRVEDAEHNGWTHVLGKDRKPVKRIVGTSKIGGGLTAFAMEIPLVLWAEDVKRRNDLARDRMDQIRKAPISAPAGVAQRADVDKFYSPQKEALSIREVAAIDPRLKQQQQAS